MDTPCRPHVASRIGDVKCHYSGPFSGVGPVFAAWLVLCMDSLAAIVRATGRSNEMAAGDTLLNDNEREYYELLFVANPLPMWIFELASGRFLAVNAQACRQYGFSEAEFLAMTIS